MKKQISTFFKIIIITIFIIVILIAFIGYYLIKENINAEESSKITETDLLSIPKNMKDSLDFLYNYSNQNTDYKLTFLEFGATTCHECKKMESVMREVKEKFNTVNVVFYNVRDKENNRMVETFRNTNDSCSGTARQKRQKNVSGILVFILQTV